MFSIAYWSIGFITGLLILNWFRSRFKILRLHAIVDQCAKEKRAARDKHRDELLNLLRTKYSKHLPERAIADRIFQSTAVELLDGFDKKIFTYTQVIVVLSLRAIKIGQRLNCTTEEFFDQALEYAEKLDNDSNNNDDQIEYLLKGIPISLKDQINQKGADSSMGITMRNFQPASKDGLIVELLKQQGAFPGFVRSATIQAMMLPETESRTYGIAHNPFDIERTTGGSTGGEGALIAACGSPIGIGTDIGGSIRIPAHFCGIFGFKPTPGRLTTESAAVPSLKNVTGQLNISATIGPLARCTDDLVLVMRSFLQENMWSNDPELIRQPWRVERFNDKKRLRIGFYTDDKWFAPAPACVRAVNEAAEALRSVGHTVIPFTPIDLPEAIRLFIGIIGADGYRHFTESLQAEPLNALYIPVLQGARIPYFIRPLVARLLRIFGEQRNAHIVQSSGLKTAYEYFTLIMDRQIYVRKWLDELRKNNIDLLLAPVNGLTAYRHGQSSYLFHSCSYTLLYNILQFPAGVVPVTLVRDDEQYYEDINNLHHDMATKLAKDACRNSAGLPVGVQLVGWPNDDERVLSVMKELETIIGNGQSLMPNFAKHIDIYSD